MVSITKFHILRDTLVLWGFLNEEGFLDTHDICAVASFPGVAFQGDPRLIFLFFYAVLKYHNQGSLQKKIFNLKLMVSES